METPQQPIKSSIKETHIIKKGTIVFDGDLYIIVTNRSFTINYDNTYFEGTVIAKSNDSTSYIKIGDHKVFKKEGFKEAIMSDFIRRFNV